MVKTFIEGTGVCGVKIEFNLADVFMLNNEILNALNDKMRAVPILQTVEQDAETELQQREDYKDMDWKARNKKLDFIRNDIVSKAYRQYKSYMDLYRQANFTFDDKHYHMLYILLNKFTLPKGSEATIFDDEE